MIQLFDAVTLGDTRVTKAGYLVADARVARTGVQTYLGRELGRPDLDRVRLYRSPEEVFSSDSLASFAHNPVTEDHPSEMVSAANWKLHARGSTGNEVMRDGEFVRVPMMVSDSDAIASIQSGKRELSAGYTCDVDFTPGVTPGGEAYDARQTNIRANHVAIVHRGRAGSACRIADHRENPIKEPSSMKTIMLDGVAVETTDEGYAAVVNLQAALNGAVAKVSAKDGEIDALKAAHATELAAANAKVLDAAALDAAIAARIAVIDAAKTILGKNFDPTGKSDAEIRRAAVAAKLGDAKVAGKDDAYVGAAFDTLTAVGIGGTAAKDPILDALVANEPATKAELSAYDAHVLWLSNAHKGTTEKAA